MFNNQCPHQCTNNNLMLFDSLEGFMLGNLFKNLYMSYRGFSNYFFQSENERQDLLTKYQMYSFSAHELNLYLDTHPKDQHALSLFNDFIQKKKEAKKIFEKKYGPLDVNFNTNKDFFEWTKGPWPWECC